MKGRKAMQHSKVPNVHPCLEPFLLEISLTPSSHPKYQVVEGFP
jgi:hypothetical protein